MTLDATFDALRASGRRALVAYLCVGDPSLDESLDLAVAAVESGADVLELGVPFSDPTADGPAIQRAAQRALAAGATLDGVLDVAARVRALVAAPLVLFTYANPLLVRGEARVVAAAADAGVDALLVVDLPPEEAGVVRSAAAARGLALVPLVAPTTGPARLDAILAASRAPGLPRGFVYYVSVAGVTGGRAATLAAARHAAVSLRARAAAPVVVGFGIDGAAAAREAAGPRGEDGPDGIVVGTALVRRIEDGPTPAARLVAVRALVTELRVALDA